MVLRAGQQYGRGRADLSALPNPIRTHPFKFGMTVLRECAGPPKRWACAICDWLMGCCVCGDAAFFVSVSPHDGSYGPDLCALHPRSALALPFPAVSCPPVAWLAAERFTVSPSGALSRLRTALSISTLLRNSTFVTITLGATTSLCAAAERSCLLRCVFIIEVVGGGVGAHGTETQNEASNVCHPTPRGCRICKRLLFCPLGGCISFGSVLLGAGN